MNKTIAALLILSLTGCMNTSVKEVKYSNMRLPPGLTGCKFFEVATTRGYQQLVRCPLSTTVIDSLDVSVKTTTTVETNLK